MMAAQMSNTSTELAKTRNRAAAERTTLAWIRTALALISFGFGLDKIISAIRDWTLQRKFPGNSIINGEQYSSTWGIASQYELGAPSLYCCLRHHWLFFRQSGRHQSDAVEERSIGDLLRTLSGMFTGVFGVLVGIAFVLGGLEEARTLSSRLTASLTIIVLGLLGPGWISHQLRMYQRNH